MPSTLAQAAVTRSPLALVTAADARVLGIRVPSPAHHRVRPGVYVDAAPWRRLAPWQRYCVRVHAYLRCRPDAVLCLESAAVVLGLPLFGEPRDIPVSAPGARTSRRFGDVVLHTSDDDREITRIEGALVTSLLDTVVDLARAHPPARALAVADAGISARRGGTLVLDELTARNAQRRSRRGRARAAWALDRADGDAESVGESVSRAVIEWCGYERPELQRVFRYEGHIDRGDFYFPAANAVGESDGWGKYQLHDPQTAARMLAAEKRREDRLRRHGHGFARWDLADAVRVRPLEVALAASGVPRVRPREAAMLATLGDRRRDAPPVAPPLRHASSGRAPARHTTPAETHRHAVCLTQKLCLTPEVRVVSGQCAVRAPCPAGTCLC
ncbi:hypothetical protein [Microbacterium sp.]|uniref:hypothetical protein n=1 Tax=Microbacterium sp. TaxID=51671 RepID=UPI0037C8938F